MSEETKAGREIVLCIPTISQFEPLKKAVDSAMAGELKPDRILIIDNSGGMLYEPWVDEHPNLTVLVPPRNMGVAGSWNYFMAVVGLDNPNNIAVIANDDVQFYPDTLTRLVAGIDAHPDCGLFISEPMEKNTFSLFHLRYSVWAALGPFDPIFFPAYFEDNDYMRRLTLAGVKVCRLTDFTFGHVGSATMKAFNKEEMEAHHKRFETNRDRYLEKWGGLPHEETYETAYNRPVDDPYWPDMYPGTITSVETSK